MKCATLISVAAALCLALGPAWAGEAATPSAGAAASESPIGVVGEVKPRPELQAMSGVKAWIINGREITMAEVEKLSAAYHGPSVLQDAVAEILLAQEAAKKGITLSDEEVQQAVVEWREQLGVRSDVAFESFLRTQNATPEWFRDKARAYALMRKVLADQVYVSDREVEAHYKRNQEMYRRGETIAFRLMSFPDKAGADAALAEVRKGKSFAEVAKATATSAQERTVAGEVQYLEQGQPGVPPELQTALFAAPLNQAVGPVAAMGQYLLIKVERKIDAHQFTLDEVKDVIRDQLSRQKLEQVVWPNWIREKLNSASIEVVRGQ
ncbi:MAG: peptidyl-prolyl cis-trans isomerase [Armatimonadota bacterium]